MKKLEITKFKNNLRNLVALHITSIIITFIWLFTFFLGVMKLSFDEKVVVPHEDGYEASNKVAFNSIILLTFCYLPLLFIKVAIIIFTIFVVKTLWDIKDNSKIYSDNIKSDAKVAAILLIISLFVSLLVLPIIGIYLSYKLCEKLEKPNVNTKEDKEDITLAELVEED